MSGKGTNLYWHHPSVTVDERRESYKYKSCVIWFTGLSAAGKSTLANSLCRHLHAIGVNSYVLDGDNIRHGLNKDLGFSADDRKENIRRLGEVAKLFVDAGVIAMTAFISPYEEDRNSARKLVKEDEFIEVFVKCSIDECERRDPKGMYKKAKAGQVKEFTGISAPYEEPKNPEVVLETDKMTLGECIERLVGYLVESDYLRNTTDRLVGI